MLIIVIPNSLNLYGSVGSVDEDSYHLECGTLLIGKCYQCCTGACCLHFQCVCSSRRYR